jgi:phosphoenolpyruvate synthase/pyruvate phosphate dikinase
MRELGAMVRLLERAFGWPVDVECAFARGRLYLLQCRPITALERAA